jgi:hypothetical protein
MAYKRGLPTFNKDTEIVGNPKGYEKETSPLKTGPYEKKLDTVGSGSTKTVRMISGSGEVLGQERFGTTAAKKLADKYAKEKEYTKQRRTISKEFLESREMTGKVAKKKK